MKTFLASITALWMATTAFAEPYLLMAEEDGCYWCERWNKEISAIYPKTPEGHAAPLQRADIHDLPKSVSFERRVHFTPTFILIDKDKEIARIEGYPGEDFFWGLLGMMLEKAEIPYKNAG